MRIPVGKISLFIGFGVFSAFGQEAVESSATGAPAQSPSPSTSSRAAEPSSKTSDTSTALDYLFNRKPQEGSAGKKAFNASQQAEGKAAAEDAVGIPRAGDSQLRARFDRYLGTAEVPQEALLKYLSELNRVSALLTANKIFDAWRKLYDLTEYQTIDAGVSRELANRIESIWNMDKTTVHLDNKNEQLRKAIKTANANADLMSEMMRNEEIEYQRKSSQGNRKQQNERSGSSQPDGGTSKGQDGGMSPPPSMGSLQGKLQLTEEYLRSLELKAKIKLNELKQEQLLDEAKKNFSDYISTLFNSGRLNHVVLAADFYRKIFQESEYPSSMAQQVNASLEINRDVQSAVEVFRYKLDRNQLVAASDSLQQAFLTSELNPTVLGLERPLKEKVADFYGKLDQMRNLIESRDFGRLEGMLDEIHTISSDFDTTKPLAMVNAVKLESKMHLGKAKLAAQQGDLKLAMEEFQSAAETWPGNPELENKAGTFFDTQDVKNQSLAEFDRLVQEENNRAIFDKQLSFAPAVKGDPKREEALKKALLSIKDAEVASEKANVLMMNGDFYGAWEAIELASSKLPDDKKLNKLRADLSGRSAEFVSAINKARDAEGRNEIGFSITWYVNAQRQYPASQIANEGIERLSKKLLESKM